MAEENKDIGSDGIPMELPIVQYDITKIFSGLAPAVCPRCIWRGLVETPSEFLVEDCFCQECLKYGKEISLVGDVHWEAKGIAVPPMGATIPKDSDECCKDFLPGLYAIHKSCEHAALNGVGIKLPPVKYCPWCGDGPKFMPEVKR